MGTGFFEHFGCILRRRLPEAPKKPQVPPEGRNLILGHTTTDGIERDHRFSSLEKLGQLRKSGVLWVVLA